MIFKNFNIEKQKLLKVDTLLSIFMFEKLYSFVFYIKNIKTTTLFAILLFKMIKNNKIKWN